MKPKDSKEYEAIPTPEGRAKWLLKKGVKGKIMMDTKTMSISYRAAVLDTVLPTGDHASEEEAIAAGNAWLAEKAGIHCENGEHVHPYQRGRAALTGLMVELRKGIETGRLVGVARCGLICFFIPIDQEPASQE